MNLTVAAFQAVASNADWAKASGVYLILTDQPGEASRPIAAATCILLHKEPTDKAASATALTFFKWPSPRAINGGKARLYPDAGAGDHA